MEFLYFSLFQIGSLHLVPGRLLRKVSQLCPVHTGHALTRSSSCADGGGQRHLASLFLHLNNVPDLNEKVFHEDMVSSLTGFE